MSYATAKGYRAEAMIVDLLTPFGTDVRRPRTTSRRETDTGDVHGLPLVVSVKNHAALALALWVDEVAGMVKRSPYETGVVFHKRRGRGSGADFYVTTSARLFLPLLRAYVGSDESVHR